MAFAKQGVFIKFISLLVFYVTYHEINKAFNGHFVLVTEILILRLSILVYFKIENRKLSIFCSSGKQKKIA